MSKKLLIIFFSVSYIFGLSAYYTENIVLFTSIILIVIIILFRKCFISEKVMIIFLFIFFIGLLNAVVRNKDSDRLSSFAPVSDIKVVGKVVSLPASFNYGFTKFTLETESYTPYGKETEYDKSKVLVNLFIPKEKFDLIEIGDKLELKGRLTKPQRTSNPSEFCYASYLKNQHIFSRLYVQGSDFKVITEPESFLHKILFKLNRLRKRMIGLHSHNIKSPSLELLGGIVFGDDAVNPTPEMKTSFIKSGLMHIIAASGMNVSVIFGMWFFISQILRINYKFSIFFGMLSVICYTCMTGFGPPVLRAALMLLLILFGKLINRKADSVSLLFIVAFILLLFSPTMLMNVGFQLSFTVTLGLLLFCPVVMDNVKNKIFSMTISFVFIPFVAQLFASPVQMFYFNNFTPYSVLANILVVPTLSVVSFGGFLSCLFALISPVSESVIKIFDVVLYPFLKYINFVADYFSNLPYSSIEVPSPSIFQIVLYYSIFFIIYFIITSDNYKKHFFVLFSVLSIIFLCSFISFPTKNTEILFFDVGNADAALIITPSGKRILIDTGKAPYKDFSPAAERVIYNYFKNTGINKLDAIVVTHYDSDHSGGTPFLLKNLKVDKLFVREIPDINLKSLNQTTNHIYQAASEQKVPMIVPEQNKVMLSDKTFKIFANYVPNGDDNESSIVNVYTDNFGNTALFCADAENKSLIKLVKNFPSKTSILKVAHHGAKNTVSNELLKFINPKYALVSTGFNIYGHPDKETLSLLQQNHVKILRTDRDNAVKFILQKNKILVYSYNARSKKFEKIYD